MVEYILAMTLADVVQWGGAAFVLYGYYEYGNKHALTGGLATLFGNVMFVWWGSETSNWGVAFMNAFIFLTILGNMAAVWWYARKLRKLTR